MKRLQYLMVCAAALIITGMAANTASAQLFPLFPPKYNENGDRVGLFGRVRSSYPKAAFASGGGCMGYSTGYSYSTGSGCTGYSGGGYSSYMPGYSYSYVQQVNPPATMGATADNCFFSTASKANWPYPIAWVNSTGCVMAFFSSDSLTGETPVGMKKVYRNQAPAAATPQKGVKAMPACGNPDCTCTNCTCEGTCLCRAVMPPERTPVMAPMANPVATYYDDGTCVGPYCPNCPR